MLARALALASLLLASCSDATVGARNAAPELTVVRPLDGASFDPSVPLELCAAVSDDGALSSLALHVESDVDGLVAEGEAEACPGGNAGWSLLLSDATHTLAVFATDSGGRVGTSSVSVWPTASSAPRCSISSPVQGEAFEIGTSFAFVGHATDEDSGARSLAATVSSSVDGELWAGTPDSDGSIAVTLRPASPGAATLTLLLVDPRGERASCSVDVYLNPCEDDDGDDWSTCEGDCDDGLPATYPGAPELPDGRDNDCDEVVDEGTVLVDDDGDGYTELDGDCDDADAAVNPGAAESWYDGIDQDCDGRDDDRDRDGFGFAEDCDEFDALVFPGAYDACYDFVDADCGLDDDFDCDGDGVAAAAFGGDDCNDADPGTYPGAPETWYDGLDQDCDGGNDFDADGDAFTSAAYGGADCDDADAAVRPAATEVYYDGVDQDCDGRSDFDADGDGYDASAYGGDDCDDTARAVNPAAAESWYDGVDQDCDGRSDFDADGDGDLASAHGGGDCDDDDPATYSTAPEVRDAADNDCDGGCDEGLFVEGDLVVSEFMKDPAKVADSEGEWFEVHNASGADVLMCGWVVSDDGGDRFTMISEVFLAAGDYAVFARSGNGSVNGGVAADYVYGTGMQLGNGADEIVLEESGVEIDRVAYDDGVDWPDPTGLSVTLDPTMLDAFDNDDGANWCSGRTAYGLGDKGTPGSANDGC